MKKSTSIFLLSAMVMTSVGTTSPAAWQKVKKFFAKHKSKIIAGTVAAAAVGVGVGLTYHAKKTLDVLSDVDEENYMAAVAAVGFFGPLGMKTTLKLMDKAYAGNWFTLSQLSVLVNPPIGKALAKYWGVDYGTYVRAGVKYAAKGVATKFIGDAKETVNNIVNWTKKALSTK